jgi:hypothetical protein
MQHAYRTQLSVQYRYIMHFELVALVLLIFPHLYRSGDSVREWRNQAAWLPLQYYRYSNAMSSATRHAATLAPRAKRAAWQTYE